MPAFKDTEGRNWSVGITVATIKRVRDLMDVDLMEAVEGKLLDRLSTDPVLLVDVVYAVCKPEADIVGVTDVQFGTAMAGDVIEHATVALIEAIIDFFPNPRDRATMRKVYTSTQRMMEKARDVIEHRLESGEMEKVEARLLQELGEQSGTSPE
jgi:hypothetical protein